MKHKLLLFLSLTILLAFTVACTGGEPEDVKETVAETIVEEVEVVEDTAIVAPECEPTHRFVMVVLISAHPFWNPIKQGAQDAADELCVEFEFTGPVEFDAAAQATQIETLIATNPDGFLVGSYDPSMTQTINRVVEAGIPVITFDSDAPLSDRAVFIGPDFYALGQQLAQNMADLIDYEGEVALLTVISQSNLQEVVRGIEDFYAENAPEIEIVAIEDNQGDDQITADKAKLVALAHPNLAGIHVVNATGSGVAAALRELDKVGEIMVVGGGLSDPVLQAILDGEIQMISTVNVYLEGYYGVKLLYDLANGNLAGVPGADVGAAQLPAYINPGSTYITKDNAEFFFDRPE
jgi:ribose transport system substrate-binding protein